MIQAMNDKVIHRGPDDEGFYLKENFALAHRRLSILDLSKAGHQPMERGGFCITYNGEVYNYIELKQELQSLGHQFSSGTDTEVILAAYKQWGTESFGRFNGMWAFAIFDAEKNRIILSRDHFGIKPLYYWRNKDYFCSFSEIKQLTAFDFFTPVLNKGAAVNFLTNGWLNYSSETFFDGVNQVLPGHYLEYDLSRNNWKMVRWYDLEKKAKKINQSFDEASEKFRELLVDSIRIRMRSDVNVGSCLSGGLDSSSIVSLVHSNKLANESFKTITSCYTDKKFDEQKYSDVITAKTKFESLKVFPQLNELNSAGHLDKIIYHQDQPIPNCSHYSEFKVFQEASDNSLIVMLDGQGSDEFLCGYTRFKQVMVSDLLYKGKFGKALRSLKLNADANASTLKRQLKIFLGTTYYAPWVNKIKSLLGLHKHRYLSAEWNSLANKTSKFWFSPTIRRQSLNEVQFTSIPYQLHSEDRNSMLFSIESRLPFLDPRLVEFGIGLPPEYKYNSGITKFILRESVRELPDEIRNRKDKMGFVAPEEQWIKDNALTVRTAIEELVTGYNVFTVALLQDFDKFLKTGSDYQPVFFRAFSFLRFCKIFNVRFS